MGFSVTPTGDHSSELFSSIKNGISQQRQTLGTNMFGVFIYAMRSINWQNMSSDGGYHLRRFPHEFTQLDLNRIEQLNTQFDLSFNWQRQHFLFVLSPNGFFKFLLFLFQRFSTVNMIQTVRWFQIRQYVAFHQ